METLQNLLNECYKIFANYNDRQLKSGEKFNVFEVCQINDKEVIMCRFLAEIINPHGSNPYAKDMLDGFLKEILGIEYIYDFSKVKVSTEYKIDENRRIDILIETSDTKIPIEAKIYASDQKRQCKDYFDFVNKYNYKEKYKVYYLTLDGHLPMGEGVEGLTATPNKDGYEEIIPISFIDICKWLNKYVENTRYSENIRTLLKQFVIALEGDAFVGNNEYTNNIATKICESKENIIAANGIKQCYDKARKNMIKKIFKTLDEKISKEFGLERYDTAYEYEDRVDEYYSRKESSYPGITYSFLKWNDYDICFRVEINWRIFCGFHLYKNGDEVDAKDVVGDEKIIKLIGREINDDDWLYWEYLPDGIMKNSPNFKEEDEAFFNLFDDTKFDTFINDAINIIKTYLSENLK